MEPVFIPEICRRKEKDLAEKYACAAVRTQRRVPMGFAEFPAVV